MDFLKALFSTDVRLLSKNERIFLLLFYALIPFLLIFLLFIFINNSTIFLLAISGSVLSFGLTIPWIYFEKLEEKYGSFSQFHFGMTYQLVARYLPLFAPGLIALSLSLSYILDNLTLGIFVSLSFIIPSLIFFRSDVFNDENCLVNEEIVFGYPTGIYTIISTAFGLYGFYNAYLVMNNIYDVIFLVIITTTCQLMLLFPDFMNRYLPIDIRLKKYFLLIISILTLIFLTLIYSLQNQINFNMTGVSILKLILIIVLSIILYKWYIHKIK